MLEGHKKSLMQWLRRHNYDVGVRYYPVAKYIRRLDSRKQWRILDVGSGVMGIAQFLPGWKVVGIDTEVVEEAFHGIPVVKGSATSLPFSNHSWDVVTCIDVLEHLLPSDRDLVLAELVRFARSLVAVAFPFGKRARHADRRMSEAYAGIGRCPPKWVSEHLRHPYPEILKLETQLEALRDDTFHMEYWHIFNEHLVLQGLHRYLPRAFLPGYKVFTLLCSFVLPLLGQGRIYFMVTRAGSPHEDKARSRQLVALHASPGVKKQVRTFLARKKAHKED